MGRAVPAPRGRSVAAASDDARRRAVHGTHRVAAGFLIWLQLEETTLLRLGQQVIERTKAMRALVEPRVPPFDGLLDHRSPDRFVLAALLGYRFEGLDHQVQRLGPVGPLVVTVLVAVGRRAGRRHGVGPAARLRRLL